MKNQSGQFQLAGGRLIPVQVSAAGGQVTGSSPGQVRLLNMQVRQ